jgi:hypothetical protein
MWRDAMQCDVRERGESAFQSGQDKTNGRPARTLVAARLINGVTGLVRGTWCLRLVLGTCPERQDCIDSHDTRYG